MAFFAWVALIFVAGSADRMFLSFGISYTKQVHVFRALVLLVPPVVFIVAKRVCDQLRTSRARPAAGGPARVVRRRPDGGFETQ
ncbi:MAG: hypothetical protein ACXVFL_15075 [Solirubrobacteraceae bacterium]